MAMGLGFGGLLKKAKNIVSNRLNDKAARLMSGDKSVLPEPKFSKNTDNIVPLPSGAKPNKMNTKGDDFVLFSSEKLLGIEKASDELINNIKKKGRRVVIAKKGSDEEKMLDYFGAEASVGGEDMMSIVLRENPSKATILEEFLHGTQHKLGIIEELGQ